MPLQRQLAIAVGIIALTTLPLLVVDTVPTLALAIFVSGVAISPTFITAFGLIERRVPAAMLTEGVTWVMTGIGIGMALGSFATGWVVDNFGAHNGFWVSVAAGTAALLTVLLGQRSLAGDRFRWRSRRVSVSRSAASQPAEPNKASQLPSGRETGRRSAARRPAMCDVHLPGADQAQLRLVPN